MWPFGKKNKANENDVEALLTKVLGKEYDFYQAHEKKRNEFETSRYGRALKRHLELGQALIDAPASALETVAHEMVRLASDARLGMIEEHKLQAEAAKQYGWKPRPFSLPRHLGFQQLAIIREREKRFDDVIELCNEARQQGWNGDWDKRIERCRARLARESSDSPTKLQSIVCGQCGSPDLKSTDRFCPSCGTRLPNSAT